MLDAGSGTVAVDPDAAAVAAAEATIAERAAAASAPITDGALKDGTKVPLLANLGSPKDAAAAVALGAEGVGLFRTEFLFLDSSDRPDRRGPERSSTPSSCSTSPAGRSSCARWMPAPTSR